MALHGARRSWTGLELHLLSARRSSAGPPTGLVHSPGPGAGRAPAWPAGNYGGDLLRPARRGLAGSGAPPAAAPPPKTRQTTPTARRTLAPTGRGLSAAHPHGAPGHGIAFLAGTCSGHERYGPARLSLGVTPGLRATELSPARSSEHAFRLMNSIFSPRSTGAPRNPIDLDAGLESPR